MYGAYKMDMHVCQIYNSAHSKFYHISWIINNKIGKYDATIGRIIDR